LRNSFFWKYTTQVGIIPLPATEIYPLAQKHLGSLLSQWREIEIAE